FINIQQLLKKGKKRKLLYLLAILINPLEKRKRMKVFQEFQKKFLILSNRINSVNDINHNNYNMFIIGSDQVWNINITKNLNKMYWGDFSHNLKKIAYAVSMGTGQESTLFELKTNNQLSNFNSISVRENSLKESLFKHFNTISQTVLDPTFLIEKFKWKSLSVKPNFNKRYVLIYQLKRTPHSLKIGKKIAEQL